jgi:hypothetical protein
MRAFIQVGRFGGDSGTALRTCRSAVDKLLATQLAEQHIVRSVEQFALALQAHWWIQQIDTCMPGRAPVMPTNC